MTASQAPSSSLSSSTSKKHTPKRAVSFQNTGKHSCPQKKDSKQLSLHNDSFLQSTDKRRKYMRRGSKSPSMLKLSDEDFASLALEFADKSNTSDFLCKGRRLSIMSALKVNFEKSAIIEPKVASKIRRMSMEQQRNFTYELLSKV